MNFLRRRPVRGGGVRTLSRGDLVLPQATWTGRRRCHRRQAARSAIASSRRAFRGGLMTQKDCNAPSELAGKATVYNAACRQRVGSQRGRRAFP